MGTHPIFESDFDCLTEKMFSPGGRPSLLGSLNRSGTNQDRSDSPISATSPYSNRFHGDTRMLGTATIPSITGNHYLNPNNQRNQAITNSMNTHMPLKSMIKVGPRANPTLLFQIVN